MFSLFRKRENQLVVPEWANFLGSDEYSRFLKSLDKYFAKKGIVYQISEGVIYVKEDDFGFNQLGLANVAQLCKLEGIGKSDKLVENHFEGLIRAHQFDTRFKGFVEDFGKVKEYIGVRLYNDNYLDQIGRELVIAKNIAPEINAMLIFDLPDSVTSIQPQQAEKWDVSIDELFEIGKANIRSKYDFEISEEDLGNFKVWFVQTDHFFAPNILLELNEYTKMIGSNGSLIGVPHRHAVIVYPIENLEIVKAVNQLIPTIKGMNAEGPGSLSSKLYWYKEDGFIELPSEITDDNQLKFMPPEAFVDMLNLLDEK
ncbi:hypothetical protein [Fulvivirga sp.]|uniref:hypothetical protein n=1 Tax=Fulvivirga sp. TaxID=1931237 RepID=UPI0032EE6E82